MRVFVYIPAYNAEKYIALSIESVLAQDYPVEKIIVVDDGSRDKTVSIAQKYPVDILRNEKNEGLAFSRNRAVLSRGAEFVGSIDADCVAGVDWLKECLRHFSSPGVAGVGGRLVETGKNIADKWRKEHLAQNPGEQRVREVEFLAGCNTVYRRQALLDCGLYDSKYRRYHEDSELGRRLRSKGGKALIYAPGALVWHIKEDSVYSVMESCWNFRHPDGLNSTGGFVRDTIRELKHAASITARDLFQGRFSLFPVDLAYFFWQLYFSGRSLISETISKTGQD